MHHWFRGWTPLHTIIQYFVIVYLHMSLGTLQWSQYRSKIQNGPHNIDNTTGTLPFKSNKELYSFRNEKRKYGLQYVKQALTIRTNMQH